MSPREMLRLVGNRLAKSARIEMVGTMRHHREPGAIDGYGEGHSVLVTVKSGATFRVTVTMYDLGIGE